MIYHKVYKSGFVLGPLELEFAPGITCLVGKNGAGKSTLIRMIAGLDKASTSGASTGAQVNIGYLPQDITFPHHATCMQYIQHVCWLQGVTKTHIAQESLRVLETVNLTDRRNQKIGQLSGGMKQRLGIAQALVGNPELLILDEPTVGLDPTERRSLRRVIVSESKNRSVLIATHMLDEVQSMADRVVILRNGSVVLEDSVSGILGLLDPNYSGENPFEDIVSDLMESSGAREVQGTRA